MFVITALSLYCSKEKVVSFFTDWGNTLLKFRFRSASGDIFQGVLLPAYYELCSIGINLKSDCTDILIGIIYNMSILLVHLQFKVILVGTFII